jgi:phospholipid-binding lipoprotein MlaA
MNVRAIGRVTRACFAALAIFAVAGCASLSQDQADRAESIAVNDPFEPANRAVFALNEVIDTILLRPIAIAYRELVPGPAKTAVFNFVRNLSLPLTIVNDVLQGEWDRADTATRRFVVNSVAGIGGLFDVATDIGLPHHKEDFGQTFATLEVVPGPYLVLPILGPSSTRHTFGRVLDFLLDPVSFASASAPFEAKMAVRGLTIVDQRYQLLGPLDEVKRTSLDYYAALRSAYRQRRDYEIRNKDQKPTDAGASRPPVQ